MFTVSIYKSLTILNWLFLLCFKMRCIMLATIAAESTGLLFTDMMISSSLYNNVLTKLLIKICSELLHEDYPLLLNVIKISIKIQYSYFI